MDVGPAHQPHSPLAFLSGGWATFPMCGTVPHISQQLERYLFLILIPTCSFVLCFELILFYKPGLFSGDITSYLFQVIEQQ